MEEVLKHSNLMKDGETQFLDLDDKTRQLVESLRQQVLLLRQQLLKSASSSGKDVVSLDDAKTRLKDAVERLMNGDESAQVEYDKWDKIVSEHPDHIAELADRDASWETEERSNNLEALATMQSFIPEDIYQLSMQDLQDRGLPAELSKRLFNKKCLWLLRISPEKVSKFHVADLRGKYSTQGLDIVELRAVYSVFPSVFENDPQGAKLRVHQDMRSKLVTMVQKETEGKLAANELRNKVYFTQVNGSLAPIEPIDQEVAPDSGRGMEELYPTNCIRRALELHMKTSQSATTIRRKHHANILGSSLQAQLASQLRKVGKTDTSGQSTIADKAKLLSIQLEQKLAIPKIGLKPPQHAAGSSSLQSYNKDNSNTVEHRKEARNWKRGTSLSTLATDRASTSSSTLATDRASDAQSRVSPSIAEKVSVMASLMAKRETGHQSMNCRKEKPIPGRLSIPKQLASAIERSYTSASGSHTSTSRSHTSTSISHTSTSRSHTSTSGSHTSVAGSLTSTSGSLCTSSVHATRADQTPEVESLSAVPESTSISACESLPIDGEELTSVKHEFAQDEQLTTKQKELEMLRVEVVKLRKALSEESGVSSSRFNPRIRNLPPRNSAPDSLSEWVDIDQTGGCEYHQNSEQHTGVLENLFTTVNNVLESFDIRNGFFSRNDLTASRATASSSRLQSSSTATSPHSPSIERDILGKKSDNINSRIGAAEEELTGSRVPSLDLAGAAVYPEEVGLTLGSDSLLNTQPSPKAHLSATELSVPWSAGAPNSTCDFASSPGNTARSSVCGFANEHEGDSFDEQDWKASPVSTPLVPGSTLGGPGNMPSATTWDSGHASGKPVRFWEEGETNRPRTMSNTGMGWELLRCESEGWEDLAGSSTVHRSPGIAVSSNPNQTTAVECAQEVTKGGLKLLQSGLEVTEIDRKGSPSRRVLQLSACEKCLLVKRLKGLPSNCFQRGEKIQFERVSELMVGASPPEVNAFIHERSVMGEAYEDNQWFTLSTAKLKWHFACTTCEQCEMVCKVLSVLISRAKDVS